MCYKNVFILYILKNRISRKSIAGNKVRFHIKNNRMRGDYMDVTYEEQAQVFKALCDEKRLRILEALRDGEECACNLGEQLDIVQSSLSYHMKILCESGIVDSRQEGKWTHYKISETGTSFAAELLERITTPNTVVINSNKCCE